MPGCPSNFRFYAENGKWSVWTGASATHSRTSTLSAQATIASYMWEKWVVPVEKSKWPLYMFNGRLMRSVALSNHNKVLLTSKAPWSGLQSSKMTTWDCGKSKRGYDPRAGQANTSAALRRAHQRLAVQKGGGHKQGNNVYHVKNAWQELGIVGPHSYRLIDLDGTKAWKSRYKNQFPVTGLVSGINKYVHSTLVFCGGQKLVRKWIFKKNMIIGKRVRASNHVMWKR